jgi:hypothetical protein
MFPIFAHADCSTERIVELSKIADNITVSYTYEIGLSDAEFTIKINNMDDSIYLKDNINDSIYKGSGEITIPNKYNSGESLTYTVYSNDNNCKGESLTSKYLVLPTYNVFSTYDECTGIEDFKYCKTWTNLNGINEEEFLKAVKKYKNSLNNDKTVENTKTNSTGILKKYYFYFIVVAVVIIGIVLLLIRKIRKRL